MKCQKEENNLQVSEQRHHWRWRNIEMFFGYLQVGKTGTHTGKLSVSERFGERIAKDR